MDENKIPEVVDALKKYAWRLHSGKGPVVIYPDELLLSLFGKKIFKEVFFESKENTNGKRPWTNVEKSKQ